MLQVPYSRLYDTMLTLGIEALADNKDLVRVVVALQRRAVSFTQLVEVLGGEITLRELAAHES